MQNLKLIADKNGVTRINESRAMNFIFEACRKSCFPNRVEFLHGYAVSFGDEVNGVRNASLTCLYSGVGAIELATASVDVWDTI